MALEPSHKFLLNGSLRLTPRNCLNDPFEILVPKNIKDKYKKIIDTNKFQEYLDFIGVISLTETKDNLLMWSHYAREHSGVAFEFDIDLSDPFNFFNFYEKDEIVVRLTHKSGASFTQIWCDLPTKVVRIFHNYFSKKPIK